jgi:arylsulfate sulfotransferase
MSRPAGPFSPGPIRGQILREIDLAGNTIRETNVERINEQLAAINQDPIYYFHHDIRRLPNGHTLAMAGVEKILSDVQGAGPIDVVGDMILDLDENFQLVWAWSTFGHDDMLPVTRRALRDEVCTGSEATGNVCGPLRQGSLSGDPSDTKPVAHDWTHGNTLTYTPADGNIILSFRHQDWVIKVDYSDGKGTGKILWRLGKDGDFDIEQKLDAPDPYPWFSAQHQPMIYAQNELVIYDNSNVRRPAGLPDNAQGPNSRGQVYLLDEENMIATLVTNADLGVYASFLGSAQKLANGNYHFLSGGIAGAAPSPIPGFPSGLSQSTETNPEGEIVYTLEASHDTTYRSFRMKSMYAPAGIPGDADGDSDVDAKDLAEIGSRLFSRAAGAGDPCDLDGDGWVTLDDLREAKNQCTLPQCRVLRWEDPMIGY